MHHGEYVVAAIAGHQELLGPDVTVTHLLLKNHVADLIGRAPYALFTEAVTRHLELPLDDAVAVTEDYEHYATVRGHLLTLP
jgi:hypothetical protein